MPFAPWEQPPAQAAPWEMPVTDNTPQEPSFLRNLGESALARGQEAVGLGQTAFNLTTGLLGQVAGGLRGMYELARTGGDFDAASRGVHESAAFLADNLRMGMSETGQKQEEWLAEKINWLKDELEPQLVAAGVDPIHAANLASATIDTTLTFLPFIPKGLKSLGKGLGRAGSAATDALARSMTAEKAPTLGSPIQQIGKAERTGGPVERVAEPPLADRVYTASQERLTAPPAPPQAVTPTPPIPPEAEAPSRAAPKPTEAPTRQGVATDLPFDKPKGDVPFYRQGSLRNIIDSPYYRALKVTGGENHPLVAGLRKVETDIIQKRAEFQPLEREYAQAVSALPKRLQTQYKDAILKGDNEKAINTLARSRKVKTVAGAQDLMGRLKNALDTRFGEVVATGVKQNYIEGYHPRQIVDPKGFADAFEKLMEKHQREGVVSGVEKTRKEVLDLTKEVQEGKINFDEYSRKIDKVLNQGVVRKIVDPKSQFSKTREITKVPEPLQRYYARPEEAMANYFTDTAKVIAERKYLGKGAENVEQGIANRLASELEAGRINDRQFVEWQKILQERFRPQAAQSQTITGLKNLGYLGTIGNPLSAAIQVLDVIPSTMRYGVTNTLRSVARSLTPGVKKLRPKDLGLFETAHDLVPDTGQFAGALHKTLKITGFKRMDQFGKKVILNAARNKFKRLASSKRGIRDLEKQGWHHIYNTPEAWDGFLAALKKGDFNNPMVQEATIAELLNTQPIALSHMPISYLRSPNGRIVYMLKTWALRQLNQIREASAKGRRGLATKLLAGVVISNMMSPHLRDTVSELAAFLTGIEGKQRDRGELSEQAMNAVLRTVFLDKYGTSKALSQGKTDAIISGVVGVPALDVFASLFSDIAMSLEAESYGETWDLSKAKRYIPVVGAFTETQKK